MATVGTGPLQDSYNRNAPNKLFYGITVGTVVDVNDPQEQGRVRVSCPGLGDPSIDVDNFNVKEIPWARVNDVFGGAETSGRSGPSATVTNGVRAHGEIHQITLFSLAIVACIDGNSQYRLVLGSLSPQFLKNTLPHGRYLIADDVLDGPFTEQETPIQPLYDNLSRAFNKQSFEWLTRGADFTSAALSNAITKRFINEIPDNANVNLRLPDGSELEIKQGYAQQKGTVYSKTTPGNHSLSMDDRAKNCRVRLRTATGKQVLLDDTNERIYISTSLNKSWIEMDDNGNIDVFSNMRVSLYGANDINISSSGRVRLYGKEGVHILSDSEIRQHAPNFHSIGETLNADLSDSIAINTTSMNLTSSSLNISTSTLDIVSDGGSWTTDSFDMNGSDIKITGNTSLSLVGGTAYLTGIDGDVNVLGTGNILLTGSAVYANSATAAAPGSIASEATPSLAATPQYAYSTNRVPFNFNDSNQMWSRSSLNPNVTDNNDVSNVNDFHSYDSMEFPYTDPRSNVVDLGVSYERNQNWRR